MTSVTSRLRVVRLEQKRVRLRISAMKKEKEYPIPVCVSTSVVQEKALRLNLLSPGPPLTNYVTTT